MDEKDMTELVKARKFLQNQEMIAALGRRLAELEVAGEEEPAEEPPILLELEEDKKIIEAPDPEIRPLPAPRWKRRCDSQQPKARYKTNAQKRKEKKQHQKARGR